VASTKVVHSTTSVGAGAVLVLDPYVINVRSDEVPLRPKQLHGFLQREQSRRSTILTETSAKRVVGIARMKEIKMSARTAKAAKKQRKQQQKRVAKYK